MPVGMYLVLSRIQVEVRDASSLPLGFSALNDFRGRRRQRRSVMGRRDNERKLGVQLRVHGFYPTPCPSE
jgi:hypothetical protein